MREEIAELPEGEPRVIVGTGNCIGEGFDDAKLDTVLPGQFLGNVYSSNTSGFYTYDYVDSQIATLSRMFAKRVRGYKSLGYVIENPPGSRTPGNFVQDLTS